jgi:hypothetical protein
MVLERTVDVNEYGARDGAKGLIARDLHAPYQPGRFSDSDLYIRAMEKRAQGER